MEWFSLDFVLGSATAFLLFYPSPALARLNVYTTNRPLSSKLSRVELIVFRKLLAVEILVNNTVSIQYFTPPRLVLIYLSSGQVHLQVPKFRIHTSTLTVDQLGGNYEPTTHVRAYRRPASICKLSRGSDTRDTCLEVPAGLKDGGSTEREIPKHRRSSSDSTPFFFGREAYLPSAIILTILVLESSERWFALRHSASTRF